MFVHLSWPSPSGISAKQSPVWSDNGHGIQLVGSKPPVAFASVVMHVGSTTGGDGSEYRGRGMAALGPHGRKLE